MEKWIVLYFKKNLLAKGCFELLWEGMIGVFLNLCKLYRSATVDGVETVDVRCGCIHRLNI